MSYSLLPDKLLSISNRIKKSPGKEYQQALIRMLFGTAVFLYIISLNWSKDLDSIIKLSLHTILYLIFGCIIFYWIYKNPKRNPFRYIVCNLTDMTGISYSIYIIGGEWGMALYPFYLWVTLGYGIRFGRSILILSTLFSIIGFLLIYISVPYWNEHRILFISLFLGLIIIPAYAANLLKQNQEMKTAEIANKAKNQFLSKMSHELRTPLNGILGSSDLLKTTTLNTEQQEYTDNIDYACTILLGLIDSILNISTIEAGKVTLKNASFDLQHLLNQISKIFTHQAHTKELYYTLSIDPDVPLALVGDVVRLKQIFENLINNSIKFTEYGGIKVQIILIDVNNNLARLRFNIYDTGCGISKSIQNRIFDLFTQEDNSITRHYDGVGLGTTIAKELVNLMGGNIGFKSNSGDGTLFWFEIPFKLQDSSITTDKKCEQINIIIISSENRDLTRIIKIINNWNTQISIVETENSAMVLINKKLSSKEKIHAIIINTVLKEIEPIIFLKNLQKKFSVINTNIIIMKDYRATLDSELVYLTGIHYILEKPVNKKLLFNAIHSSQDKNTYSEKNIKIIQSHLISKNNKKCNILCADDNKPNQKVIKRILELSGHNITIVDDGDKALEKLESDIFDLCILDMHMPNMGGLSVIKVFRFSSPEKTMPFIMLTADATVEAEQQCRENGVDLYLTKPIRSKTLISAVTELTNPITL